MVALLWGDGLPQCGGGCHGVENDTTIKMEKREGCYRRSGRQGRGRGRRRRRRRRRRGQEWLSLLSMVALNVDLWGDGLPRRGIRQRGYLDTAV
jgi:hypothetical protein